MAKQVLTKVDGEEVVVREDTAKSYRGVYWAFLSIGGFLLIAFILFLYFFAFNASQGTLDQTPADVERRARP